MKSNNEKVFLSIDRNTAEKWEKEKEQLLEENKDWLNIIKCIDLGYSLEEQEKQLCIEVLKWHELSKESFTLLESLYEQLIPLFKVIDGTVLDLKTNSFFNDLEEKFKRVKNNYINNIKSKEDKNYRPTIVL